MSIYKTVRQKIIAKQQAAAATEVARLLSETGGISDSDLDQIAHAVNSAMGVADNAANILINILKPVQKILAGEDPGVAIHEDISKAVDSMDPLFKAINEAYGVNTLSAEARVCIKNLLEELDSDCNLPEGYKITDDQISALKTGGLSEEDALKKLYQIWTKFNRSFSSQDVPGDPGVSGSDESNKNDDSASSQDVKEDLGDISSESNENDDSASPELDPTSLLQVLLSVAKGLTTLAVIQYVTEMSKVNDEGDKQFGSREGEIEFPTTNPFFASHYGQAIQMIRAVDECRGKGEDGFPTDVNPKPSYFRGWIDNFKNSCVEKVKRNFSKEAREHFGVNIEEDSFELFTERFSQIVENKAVKNYCNENKNSDECKFVLCYEGAVIESGFSSAIESCLIGLSTD